MRFLFFILSTAAAFFRAPCLHRRRCAAAAATYMLCAGPQPPAQPLSPPHKYEHRITPSGNTIKVLINDGDGEFEFSREFAAEFERTYNLCRTVLRRETLSNE